MKWLRRILYRIRATFSKNVWHLDDLMEPDIYRCKEICRHTPVHRMSPCISQLMPIVSCPMFSFFSKFKPPHRFVLSAPASRPSPLWKRCVTSQSSHIARQIGFLVCLYTALFQHAVHNTDSLLQIRLRLCGLQFSETPKVPKSFRQPKSNSTSCICKLLRTLFCDRFHPICLACFDL